MRVGSLRAGQVAQLQCLILRVVPFETERRPSSVLGIDTQRGAQYAAGLGNGGLGGVRFAAGVEHDEVVDDALIAHRSHWDTGLTELRMDQDRRRDPRIPT